HRGAVVALFLLSDRARVSLKCFGPHPIDRVIEWFDVVLDQLYRYFALKLQAQIIGQGIVANFTVTIFDDRARFDARQRKRFGFDLQTAGLDDGAVKYIFLLQFDDSAVGFHSARGNVLDAPIIQIGNIDAALRFATTLSKYLYPQVMIKTVRSVPPSTSSATFTSQKMASASASFSTTGAFKARSAGSSGRQFSAARARIG